MALLLRCPTYSCHHRPSSFPTRGGLHCQAHQLDTKAKVLSEKPTTFATNSTTFTQKSTGFSHFFWPMGAQRPTIGEKFTARERMRHKQGGAFHGFSDRGGCFSAHRPSFRCERGAMFLPFACSRRKRPVGTKERGRAGESVDEAVRKHGRKGVGTRAQKSAGRRELNVCRREEEALWAKRRLSREPSPSRRGG